MLGPAPSENAGLGLARSSTAVLEVIDLDATARVGDGDALDAAAAHDHEKAILRRFALAAAAAAFGGLRVEDGVARVVAGEGDGRVVRAVRPHHADVRR